MRGNAGKLKREHGYLNHSPPQGARIERNT